MEKKGENGKTVAYSALTLVLLLFILQAGFGMIVNIFRNIDTFAKLKYVNKAYNFAFKRNKNLKYELKTGRMSVLMLCYAKVSQDFQEIWKLLKNIFTINF